MQSVNRFTAPGQSESRTNDAVAQDADDKGAELLGQASVQATTDGNTQIALQAVDLWMSRKSRLYARLTLPVTKAPAEESVDQAQAAGTSAKLADGIVKQLVDPYGGVVNVSGGIFARLGKPGERSVQDSAIATALAGRGVSDENEVRRVLSRMQPDHGAFLDIRGGIKMIDLPDAGPRAVDVGGNKLNVFYTGIAGIKVMTPLSVRPLDPDEQSEGDIAGGVTLGAYIVGNHAADVTQSTIFDTALNRSTAAFTAVIGVSLAKVAALTFSFTPWTNDERMGKMFVFGVDVLRPSTSGTKGK
jgi:hypothetical protein